MVYIEDLKSSAVMACGFESRPGHQTYIQGFRQVGKASDFDSDMRWFESINPYQNLGLKVFMDAYMPVTHEEGDRYPLGPPILQWCC